MRFAGAGNMLGGLSWPVYNVYEIHSYSAEDAETEYETASKWMFRFLLLVYLCYAGWQIFVCVDSYSNPSWVPGGQVYPTLSFPCVKIAGYVNASAFPLNDPIRDHISVTCLVTQAGTSTTEPCSIDYTVSGAAFSATFNKANQSVALTPGTSYMTLAVISDHLDHTRPFPIYIFDPVNQPAHLPTTFFGQADGLYFASLLKIQTLDVNGKLLSSSYTATVSNSKHMDSIIGRKVGLELSFQTFFVDERNQVVLYPVELLLASLGGVGALLIVVYQYLRMGLMSYYVKKRERLAKEDSVNSGGKDNPLPDIEPAVAWPYRGH